MKLPRRKFLQFAAAAAATPGFSGVAMAQAYPSRPITMIVPFAAGGPIDALARVRAVADNVAQTIDLGNAGFSDVVENRLECFEIAVDIADDRLHAWALFRTRPEQ